MFKCINPDAYDYFLALAMALLSPIAYFHTQRVKEKLFLKEKKKEPTSVIEVVGWVLVISLFLINFKVGACKE